MPLRNGVPYCVNHTTTKLVRNEGFSAVTEVRKDGANVSFNPGSGVVVVVFFCEECGYVELYAAQKTPLWDQA